jgi:hypothetical protein
METKNGFDQEHLHKGDATSADVSFSEGRCRPFKKGLGQSDSCNSWKLQISVNLRHLQKLWEIHSKSIAKAMNFFDYLIFYLWSCNLDQLR